MPGDVHVDCKGPVWTRGDLVCVALGQGNLPASACRVVPRDGDLVRITAFLVTFSHSCLRVSEGTTGLLSQVNQIEEESGGWRERMAAEERGKGG